MAREVSQSFVALCHPSSRSPSRPQTAQKNSQSSNSESGAPQSSHIIAGEDIAEELEARAQSAAAAARAADEEGRLQDPILWVDLEMTGLDLDQHHIIEIACLVTDGLLRRTIEVRGSLALREQPHPCLAPLTCRFISSHMC